MKIELIGTGSIDAKQTSACTLINEEILVDMPNGIIKKLKQSGYDILKIKVVLITHLHGDHFLDIPFFMLDKYLKKAKEKTLIYGPIGTKLKVKQIFEIAFPGDYDIVTKFSNVEFIEFEELKEEKVLNNVYVDSKVVEHDVKPAYGYIINYDNKKIGFSGDSGLCNSIEEIIEQCDLSVLDMSLEERGSESHMGLNDIEELCKKYKDKTIISTHMRASTREKANNKNINNLIVPEDGQSVEF